MTSYASADNDGQEWQGAMEEVDGDVKGAEWYVEGGEKWMGRRLAQFEMDDDEEEKNNEKQV